MKLALAVVVMAVISAAAAAEPNRKVSAACLTGASLVELAHRAFADAPELVAATPDAKQFVCRVLRARRSTWLLTLADAGCGGLGDGAAAIIQDGAVTWSELGSSVSGTPCRGGTWQAVDLDGDGSDELLFLEDHEGHEGSARRSLTVMAIANGAPADRDQLALEWRGSSEGSGVFSYRCFARFRLVLAAHGARQIELIGHGRVADDDRCPRDGRHVYAWNGSQLVER